MQNKKDLSFLLKTRACEWYKICVKGNKVKEIMSPIHAALSDQAIYVETEIPGETAGSYRCSCYAMHFTRNGNITLIMLLIY